MNNESSFRIIETNPEHKVKSEDIYELIKLNYPNFDVSDYLGGTVNPKSLKWLFSVSICSSSSILGSVSAMSIELHQVLRHLINGRYMMNDNSHPIQKYLTNFVCALCDGNIRKVLRKLLVKPGLLRNGIHLLRLIIVQGHDISASGDMDMCEGCPDMTYFRGRLVNSCRLDEFRKYGRLITNFPEGK